MIRSRLTAVTAGVSLLALTACGGDPLAEDAPETGNETTQATGELVIGSQQYYSNTIIAEIYAQVLENEGYEVDRQFEIGQREIYLPELENGEIDLLPEYTGNLLQYLDSTVEEGSADEVQQALQEALPDGLEALDYAEATDQDSYTVTEEFADEHGLESIADLADIDEDLRIAANAEFESRPYGPDGAAEVYGVEITLVPVEDSGGPLTLNTLLDGDTEVADIYTADPAIEEHNLVSLEDPEALILPQNVVPIASQNVDEDARAAIAEVQQLLTQEALLELNTYSQEERANPDAVATWWLEEQGILTED